jgi:hypothetical protein
MAPAVTLGSTTASAADVIRVSARPAMNITVADLVIRECLILIHSSICGMKTM